MREGVRECWGDGNERDHPLILEQYDFFRYAATWLGSLGARPLEDPNVDVELLGASKVPYRIVTSLSLYNLDN